MTHSAALAPEETFVPLVSVSGQPVPLHSVELDGRLAGLFTTWTLRQRFINVEKTAIEAVYQFPLADDMSLHCVQQPALIDVTDYFQLFI